MAEASAAVDGNNSVELDATSLEEARKKYEFFWKSASPYSQWYPVKFQVEGQEYNCAEQYMMHQKAVLFKDDEAARQILSSADPKFHKKMGRRVRNFDEGVWNQQCLSIVKEANKAKFSQNEKLKKMLFSTHPKTLVEASPVDAIWGIGYAEDSYKAWNRSTWRGTNLLGLALTQVRNQLMAEEGLLG